MGGQRRASARVGRVGVGPTADSEHANDALIVVELVDDPVGADPGRPQAAKPTPKQVAHFWSALEEAESHDDRIGQRPFEVGTVLAGSSSEFDSELRCSEP